MELVVLGKFVSQIYFMILIMFELNIFLRNLGKNDEAN